MKIINLVLLLVMIAIPVVSGFPEPQDNVVNVEAARKALLSAKTELNRSGGKWGGHMENAVAHIDQALKEMDAGEQFAREHHDLNK
jgi:hypothetical protein